MVHSHNQFLSSKRHSTSWFLLAFLAGSVNAGGFLACHRFVTHVTGFATHFGIEVVTGNVMTGLGLLTVPVFFLAGAIVSGVLIERRVQVGETPRYDLAMGLVMVCIVLTLFGGAIGWFGEFGEPMLLKHDYVLLALLCMAMGVQNAVITSVSGAVIRTTHLTGITTDLGIGLARILFPMKNKGWRDHEIHFNWLRIGTILSFILGSTGGAILHLRFGYYGFLLPAFIAGYGVFLATHYWQKPRHLEVAQKHTA